MHILLPINTPVVFVDPETGEHKPAVIKNQDTPGSAYIWLDEKGQETAHARISEKKEKGTIHLQREEPAAPPKPFAPGAAANGAAKKTAPAA